MKKLNLFILVSVLMVISSSMNKLYAQQDPEYSMYMFNGLSINPAYAGARDRLAIVALYRNQWAGITGAPQTVDLTAHAPLLNDRIGVGIDLNSDNLGVLNALYATGSFSYRLPVGKGKLKGRFCMGLSASIDYYKERLAESVLIDNYDPAFSSNKSIASPNFGGGLYYYNDRFYVGAALPHMLNSSLNTSVSYSGTSDIDAREYRTFFATAGGMVDVAQNVKFKPSLLFKYVQDAPAQLDINGSFLFYESLWVGASYRTSYDQPVAVVGMVEYMFAKCFRLGYAYEYTITEIGRYQSGTHDIMLSYEFGNAKYLTPRKMSYF